MTIKKTIVCSIMAAGVLFSQSCLAAPEQYPNRPIRMLVGFAPGGAADVLGRILALKLSQALGQPVVVENRPGATTTIATDAVAHAKPDGYTLLMATSAHVVSAQLYKTLNYDPVESFAPITLIASSPLLLVAPPALRVSTIPALIAAAKANPGNISFGSSGTGSITFLAGQLLQNKTGIELLHVPYKSMSQLQSNLIGGTIKLAFTSIPATIGQLKAGQLVALGITSDKRSPSLPDVPTIAESGVPGYEVSNWYGVLAPAGTPKHIIDLLHAQIAKIVESAEGKEAIVKQGADPRVDTPEGFHNFLASEALKWKQVVQSAGIQPE